MVVSIAVEGISDAAILRRVCEALGITVGSEYVARGKARLDHRLPGYNNAARFSPWVVLRDLDHDADCAPSLVGQLLPSAAAHMYLRIPVRTVEAWLLADRAAFAQFFGVSTGAVPVDPEALDRPKRTIVDLARRSSKRVVREGLVPPKGFSAEVGPDYTASIIEYATTMWNPRVAAANSPSLERCLRALAGLDR